MSWQAFGASVIGSGHLAANLPCQDAHGWRVLGDYAIAAVADGLGSASQAAPGAQAAVKAALDNLEQSWAAGGLEPTGDPEQAIHQAFLEARTALENLATEGALRDYATTLLIAVAAPGYLCVGQLGDGAIVAQLTDDQLRTVSLPQRGEYANETLPLTALNALSQVCVTRCAEPAVVLALLTDGLQNLSINSVTGEPYAPFFSPFFTAALKPLDSEQVSAQLGEFLASARVCAKTDDDKSRGAPQAGFLYEPDRAETHLIEHSHKTMVRNGANE